LPRLLSVCVGMPRDIAWQGRVVHTGIWKQPVQGPRRVRRLNIDGDGQGDTGGHGGEQRAVFVYQIESYRHWEDQLGRRDFTPGQFGENFTVEGLADDEVCIGDRLRIGTALFEVTQPRVTCYRIGIRMDEPRMPALLTSSGRTGFYLRVLEEGEVQAGDAIVPAGQGPQRMTVAEVNALLYSDHHPRERLERALGMPALSPGWRGSFEQLLRSAAQAPGSSGNAGLVGAGGVPAAHPGFRPLRVRRLARECEDVLSIVLEPGDDRPLVRPLAGQFVVLRLRPRADAAPIFRSYSLCGEPSERCYRLGIKLEAGGVAGAFLSDGLRVDDVLEVSEPRGSFVLGNGDAPVILMSAGIGVTPVLAMLHALADGASPREVWWLHGTRSGRTHAFGAESRALLGALARGRGQVWFSRAEAGDVEARDFDAPGHMATPAFEALGVPREGDFYLCGPEGFLAGMTAALLAWGVARQRIHSEAFAGGPSLTPGIRGAVARAPHPPVDEGSAARAAPSVSFARSGLTVRWRPDRDQSLLELAEACDVPVRWSCRAGVCHNCESGIVSGEVAYRPDPLSPPAQGSILICCARPVGDVVLDL